MSGRFLGRLRTVYWAPSLVLVIVLLMLNLVLDPGFAQPSFLPATIAAFAPLAILAMASTPAILSGGGGIDISLAPMSVFVSVVLVTQTLPSNVFGGPLQSFAIAAVLGAVLGALNGVLVTVLRYQPILATLCAFFIFTGLNLKFAPTPVPAGDNWTDDLGGTIVGIPIGLILIAVPLVIWGALSRTSWMMNLFATGGDQVAAYASGVPVRGVRIVAYTLGGLFSGIASIALLGVIHAADATLASQYMIYSLTAVALGGTTLAGGRGGLVGSLLGAGSIFLLQLLLTTLGLPSAWLQVAFGGVLLLAITISGKLSLAGKGARL